MRLSSRHVLSSARLAVVDLSGPVANLLAAGLAARFNREWLWCFVGVNLTLGLFNLLPAAPLDGGRALGRLLVILLGEEAGRCCMHALSIALSLGLMASALLLLYFGMLNFTLFLIALWLLWGSDSMREERRNIPAFR